MAQREMYAHLAKSYVKVGQVIQPGQAIGLAGSTGIGTGPHVHYELRPDTPKYSKWTWKPSDISPFRRGSRKTQSYWNRNTNFYNYDQYSYTPFCLGGRNRHNGVDYVPTGNDWTLVNPHDCPVIIVFSGWNTLNSGGADGYGIQVQFKKLPKSVASSIHDPWTNKHKHPRNWGHYQYKDSYGVYFPDFVAECDLTWLTTPNPNPKKQVRVFSVKKGTVHKVAKGEDGWYTGIENGYLWLSYYSPKGRWLFAPIKHIKSGRVYLTGKRR